MKTRNLYSIASVCCLLIGPVGVFAGDRDDEDEIEFDEAHVFFELNNTDGDLGIHALIDGEPWKRLRIEDQNERRILDVKVRNRLRRQGLTEFFFESAEPTFDELSIAEFFDRFPEGTYEIEGRSLEGDEIESETEITHAMPAPANVTSLDYDSDCDDDIVVAVTPPVTIAWDPVTSTHPDPRYPQGFDDFAIYNYQVVVEVEVEVEVDGEIEEFASVLSVVLPPGVTSMTIPDEFIGQGEEFKYEVLAREESYNQTAVESCFVLD